MQIPSEYEDLEIHKFKKDPVGHIELVQGVETLEAYQKRIARFVEKYPWVAVKACHDVGKTFLAARIALWFGSCFYSKIITTAPTYNQVKRLLWSEMRAGHAKSKFPLGGEMLVTEWKISPDWYAIGFSPRSDDSANEGQGDASTFQGFHSEHILVIFDEATGIKRSIWKQVEGIMTSRHVRFLAIGNPTTKACEFYNCFKSFKFKKDSISCFDSPNLIANNITSMRLLLRELNHVKTLSDEERETHFENYKCPNAFLLTLRWVVELALELGVTHPLFVSKALAEFPEEDEHALFSLGVVEEAIRKENSKTLSPISYGVDVARFGSDKSVITKMEGGNVTLLKKHSKCDTQVIAGEIVAIVNACERSLLEGCSIVIDGTGVGGGVVDALRAYQSQKENAKTWRRVSIIEINFGEGFTAEKDGGEIAAAKKAQKYYNKKAELFLLLALDLKTDIKLLDESDYVKELPVIVYRFNAKGQYVMESKEEFKKRTGLTSPDATDSLVLANFGRHLPSFDAALPDVENFDITPMTDSLDSGDKW